VGCHGKVDGKKGGEEVSWLGRKMLPEFRPGAVCFGLHRGRRTAAREHVKAWQGDAPKHGVTQGGKERSRGAGIQQKPHWWPQVLRAPAVKSVQPGSNLERGKRWEREERVGFL
jgi:hypothetical protein